MNRLSRVISSLNKLFGMIPRDFSLLLARVAIATVFWRSAQTKISGWEFLDQSWQFFNIGSGTVMLFQYEYNLPLLSPKLAAYLGTGAEFFLPILLLLGLGTRIAAFGLFLVTCIIQFLVFPDAWPTHILWFAILVYLMRSGGGRLGVDHLLVKRG
ncbi:MAG: DoxX family protein [Pseudohongiellaceae bacterium]